MLQFKVEPKHQKIKKIPHTYPSLIEYESRLTILIDDEVFFDEPNFPLLEFLKYAIDWGKKTDLPFEYNSIETEDNPLIRFLHKDNMLCISSPWQKFHCRQLFHKEEVLDAITALLADVVSN